MNRRLAVPLLLVVVLSANCSAADTPVASPACEDQSRVLAALDAGRAAVIVVQGKVTEEELATEAYGDWVYYLEEFQTESEGRHEFLKLAPDLLGDIFADAKAFQQDRSMVFIAPDRRAWYFGDQVLEPQPYMVVAALLDGEPVPEGMQEFAPESIKIEFLKCEP